MGWIKDAKAQSMQKAAGEAWSSGAEFFTPMLNFPAFKVGFSGPIGDWPPMLEAITSVGWKLHTWSLASDEKGRPQAMPLFTR
jgi:hypothetical protein